MEAAIVEAIALHTVNAEMLNAFLATAVHENNNWLGNLYMCRFFDEAVQHSNFVVLDWLKVNRLKHATDFHETVFRTSIIYREVRTLDWLTNENPPTVFWPWHTVLMALRSTKEDYYLWYHQRTSIPEKLDRYGRIAINFPLIVYHRLIRLGLTTKLQSIILISAFSYGNLDLIMELMHNVCNARSIALAVNGSLLRRVKKRKLKKIVAFLRLTRSDCASIGFKWPI
jgi:hypothetical protein